LVEMQQMSSIARLENSNIVTLKVSFCGCFWVKNGRFLKRISANWLPFRARCQNLQRKSSLPVPFWHFKWHPKVSFYAQNFQYVSLQGNPRRIRNSYSWRQWRLDCYFGTHARVAISHCCYIGW
jgi:hypothetical protein